MQTEPWPCCRRRRPCPVTTLVVIALFHLSLFFSLFFFSFLSFSFFFCYDPLFGSAVYYQWFIIVRFWTKWRMAMTNGNGDWIELSKYFFFFFSMMMMMTCFAWWTCYSYDWIRSDLFALHLIWFNFVMYLRCRFDYFFRIALICRIFHGYLSWKFSYD